MSISISGSWSSSSIMTVIKDLLCGNGQRYVVVVRLASEHSTKILPLQRTNLSKKELNIVLLLSIKFIHLIARKNLTKAKQFYYGRVVEIKLKSLDLAGTSLVFCQRVNYCNSLFWEDFANVREVVSSMNSQLKQFDFQESEKQTGKVVKIYVWQKLKRFWKTGILMRWRGRMKNDVVASQSFPKCKI